jgi:Leucine-rich repeat (LRR) protein
LKKLWLNACPVRDLTPLTGKEFEELNLCDVKFNSPLPLGTLQAHTLWLRNTPLTDLSLLQGESLVSLDVQGCVVSDLSPIREIRHLERLNIANTGITDLTPLAGLPLVRLIFSPDKVTKGLDVVRQMPTLRQLDTSFEGNTPARTPSEFWEEFDSGKIQR